MILSSLTGEAQKAVLKQAQKDEDRNHFADAAIAFKGLNERGSREVALRVAGNLYKGRRYEEAIGYYRYSDSLSMIKNPDELFGYFESLKALKRYDEADKLVATNLKQFGHFPEFSLNNNLSGYYEKLTGLSGTSIEVLPVNSAFSDISPVFYKDWLYFVSTRAASGNRAVHRINNQHYYNLYAVPLSSDMAEVVRPSGKFGSAEKTIKYQSNTGISLPAGINKKFHDGPLYINESGDKMFFTSNWSAKKRPAEMKGYINLMIYFSEKTGDTWSAPKSFEHNSFEYSNQHGFFDSKTSTLYFSSNMPGGQGGYDIWKSSLREGVWSKPENLGPFVNTPKSEVFPTMTPDGQLLFSSNGWPGLGGLDIFLVKNSGKDPLNLMAGLNSERDDFGLVFTGNNAGYMVSSRPGGKGDDDIYSVKFDLNKISTVMTPPKRLIAATLKDSKTGALLQGAKISVSGNINNEYITDAQGTIYDSVSFDIINRNKPEIKIKIEMPGYLPAQIDIPVWKEGQPLIDSNISLTAVPAPTADGASNPALNSEPATKSAGSGGERINTSANSNKAVSITGTNVTGKTGVNNNNSAREVIVGDHSKVYSEISVNDTDKFVVYFDFDKTSIRQDAAVVLARVAYVLMEEYESSEILLSGHADSRGNGDYNNIVSMKRVERVKQWLVEHGIDAKRIRTDFQGEMKPVVQCSDPQRHGKNPDLCLTKSDHQLNRRVELKVLGVLQDR